MKKTFIISIGLFAFVGCSKTHSNAGGEDGNELIGMIVYNPASHIVTTQSFQFSGRLLTGYSERSTDTTPSSGIIQESKSYYFPYGKDSFPTGSTLIDSNLVAAGNAGGTRSDDFIFDNQSRLREDSNVLNNGGAVSFYVYSADSIYYYDGSPAGGSNPAGVLVMPGANLAVAPYEAAYTYSSLSNPLQNGTVAGTFGVFFYYGLPDVVANYFGMPLDFFSKNLPATYVDGDGNVTSFDWNTNANGKVIGGTAFNLYPNNFGHQTTSYITFVYQ